MSCIETYKAKAEKNAEHFLPHKNKNVDEAFCDERNLTSVERQLRCQSTVVSTSSAVAEETENQTIESFSGCSSSALQQNNVDKTEAMNITPNARKKGIFTGKYFKDKESLGLLLDKKESKDGIVRNILMFDFFSDGSAAKSYANFLVDACRKADEMGYKIIGFFHTHGNHDAFFSPEDEKEMGIRLFDFASATIKISGEKFEPRSMGEGYYIAHPFDIYLNEGSSIKEIKKRKITASVFGYVVNMRGEEYFCVRAKETCPFCNEDTVYPLREIKVREVNVENDIEYNEEKIMEELSGKRRGMEDYRRPKPRETGIKETAEIKEKEKLFIPEKNIIKPSEKQAKIISDFKSEIGKFYKENPSNIDAFKQILWKYGDKIQECDCLGYV